MDYPAACNAVEKVLVHDSLVGPPLDGLVAALRAAGVAVHGGARGAVALQLPPAPSARHEYSSLDVTLELVGSLDEAVDHIHAYGSGHTECVVTGGRVGWVGGWCVGGVWGGDRKEIGRAHV